MNNVINTLTVSNSDADGRRVAQMLKAFVEIYGLDSTQESVNEYFELLRREHWNQLVSGESKEVGV